MKNLCTSFLLAGLLLAAPACWAQAGNQAALRREAAALKLENTALKATKAANINGLAVGPAGEQLPVHFVSCFASRQTKQAVLTLLVDGREMACPVSLSGFSTQLPALKALEVRFVTALRDGQPTQPFATTLRNIPVVWEVN